MIHLPSLLRDLEVDFKRSFSTAMYVKVNLSKIEQANIYNTIATPKIKIIIVKKEKHFCPKTQDKILSLLLIAGSLI